MSWTKVSLRMSKVVGRLIGYQWLTGMGSSIVLSKNLELSHQADMPHCRASEDFLSTLSPTQSSVDGCSNTTLLRLTCICEHVSMWFVGSAWLRTCGGGGGWRVLKGRVDMLE